jgi:putative ABC transport system permease protein
MINSNPPKIFLRFFRWYCHPRLLDHIEGDLIEVYRQRRKIFGKRKADIKFIIDVLLLFRPRIIKPMQGHQHLNNYGMLRGYFKIGWRNLLRNKVYSFINIGGLALGITVTILISLWMYDELSFDKSHQNYDRIARVVQNVINNGEVQTWTTVPFPLAEELRKNYSSDFKHVVMAVHWGDHLLNFEDKKLKVTGVYFEKEAAEMFSIKIMHGSGNLKDPASILLSSSMAKAFFDKGDPLNKLMKIDNMPVVKVIGVYEDFPRNSTFAGLNFIATLDFLYSNDEGLRTMPDPWRPNFTTLFVELNDQMDIHTVSLKIKDAKLKRVNAQLAKKKPELFLHPMGRWHLYSEFKNGINIGGSIQYVWMFGIIGVFVLLLACINFMNLSTARSEKRAKEVGIRKTIGSFSRQLILQFFSESLLTVLFAFILSLFLVQFALPFFNEVANKQMFIAWTSPFFWLISIALIVITALVAGSYPAFYLSSFKPVKALKGTFKAGRFATMPRKVLVVLQFTVSITLIIGTVIVYQQIQFAKDRPIGYSRNSLINIPTMNPSIHNHFNAVKDELMQTGVVASLAESQSPTTGVWNSTSGLSWKGKDPDLSIDFGVVSAGLDYGKTIGWHLKEGRDFSSDFLSDSSALILNQAAVHLMGLKNPIGEVVTWWGHPNTIIGVIDDMVMESPYDEPRPVIYELSKEDGNMVIIKLNPTLIAKDALNKIEPIFKKYNTEQPFEFQFVDDDYAKKFGSEERIGKLSSFFTSLAVVISCLGIFGLASFTAEQRTKEIGIRKVLGASVSTLWRMLSKDFVVLIVLACFIAVPLSYYFLHHWLSKYAYRTEITGWVFLVTGIGAVAITLFTISYQAIKAAMMSPVNSLKSE